MKTKQNRDLWLWTCCTHYTDCRNRVDIWQDWKTKRGLRPITAILKHLWSYKIICTGFKQKFLITPAGSVPGCTRFAANGCCYLNIHITKKDTNKSNIVSVVIVFYKAFSSDENVKQKHSSYLLEIDYLINCCELKLTNLKLKKLMKWALDTKMSCCQFCFIFIFLSFWPVHWWHEWGVHILWQWYQF